MASLQIPSAQGTVAAWGGMNLEKLTRYAVSGQGVRQQDVTNLASPLLGTGNAARVVTQTDAVGVEPASITLTMLGVPPVQNADRGRTEVLSVSFPGGAAISGLACLEAIDHAGGVNELPTTTLTFRFTGF
jgi:hypothetical protein